MSLLACEACVVEGETPAFLPDALRRTPTYEITRDAFLMRVPNGLVLHYARGQGVTASRPPHVPEREINLFRNGSVYGAIAWINGFVPLHASAVVHENGVHALSGQSGLGKSTLAAALGRRGMPLFADDVLVLDTSDPAEIICLPGHKQIKLWNDALKLAGAQHSERVRAQIDKYYAVPPGGIHAGPLPLVHLTLLANRAREQASLTAVTGAERFTRFGVSLYRPEFCAAIVASNTAFAFMSRICGAVPMSLFDRPYERRLFDSTVDAMARAIRQGYDR